MFSALKCSRMSFVPMPSGRSVQLTLIGPRCCGFPVFGSGHILPRPLQAARCVRLQHFTVLSGFVDDKSEPMTDHRFVVIRFEPFGQGIGISDCDPNVFLRIGVINFVANCNCFLCAHSCRQSWLISAATFEVWRSLLVSADKFQYTIERHKTKSKNELYGGEWSSNSDLCVSSMGTL